MVGMKYADPSKIVASMLTDYVRKELAQNNNNKTAESIGYTLAGIRISRMYRRDISEPTRNLVAREFLRGILTDRHVF